jgi:hypothetical protein
MAVEIPQDIPQFKPSESEDIRKSYTPPERGKAPSPTYQTTAGGEWGSRDAPSFVAIDGGKGVMRAKLIAIIGAAGSSGIVKNELGRRMQWLKAGLRNALLDEFVNEGLVRESKQPTRTRPAIVYRTMVHERRSELRQGGTSGFYLDKGIGRRRVLSRSWLEMRVT